MDLKFYAKTSGKLASLKRFVVTLFIMIAAIGTANAQPASALNFDGINDYVTFPVNPAFNISSAITIESWIKPASTYSTQDVLSKSNNNTNNGYIFPRTSQGWKSLEFLLNINGYGWKSLKVPYGQDKLNQWHHVAATYDGYKMLIYIDGVVQGEFDFAGSITVNNNPLTLGVQPGFSEYYNGSLDETRLYNRALTACEIVNSMNCELGNTPGQMNGLVAYYKYNQGLLGLPNPTVTTVTDSSPTGVDGTMNNFGLLAGLTSNWVGGNVSGTCSEFTAPTLSVTATQVNVPIGGTISLFANGSTAGSYSWVGPNGFNSTDQNPVLTGVPASASGTYTATFTDANGCTAIGSVLITVAQMASGLNLDGVDDYIRIPNKPSLNFSSGLTIESWIYPTGGSTFIQNVVSKASRSENTGFKFPKTNDQWKTFSFELSVGGTWYTVDGTFPAAALNTWNHVAASYDGYYMRIYLNGVLAGSREVNGPIDVNSNDVLIGNQEGRVEYFGGNVDEIRIWSRGLSQCEIINNMQTCELNGDNNGIARQTGLAAYYRFNQGLVGVSNSATNILSDSSLNGNNGALTNFTLNGATSNWNVGKVYGVCDYFPLPTLNVTANGTVFQTGSTVKLFANNGNGINNWDGPNSFTSTVQNPVLNNAQPSASGTYTVTNPYVNCVITASAKITVSDQPQIIAGGPTSFCPSGSVVLTSANSGTAYQWYRNDTLIQGATANSYTATVGGNYTVTVTTASGVAVSAPLAVTVLVDNSAPVPDVTNLPTINITAPATVTTIPTATDNCRGTVNGTADQSLTFTHRGTYLITWTYDDLNGNKSTQTQQVIVARGVDNTAPVLTVPSNISAQALASTSCGAVVNFTATATDNSGDPVIITYSKAPGSVFSVGTTTVTVTATDSSNNATTGTFTVTVAPTTVAAVTGTTIVCQGATTQLADATPNGTWSTSNAAVATVSASGLVTGVAAGTATITYTNPCGVAASATVTVNAKPAAPVVSKADNCGSTTLTATGATGATFTWSNGQTGATINVPAGTYTATQSVSGCASASSAPVAATPNATPAAPAVAVTNNCDGTSTLTATGAQGASIVWTNSSTGATLSGSPVTTTVAANYTATQSLNGCLSAASTAVTAAPKTAPAAPSVSKADNCGTSVLTAAGANGATFTWSNGSTGATITVGAGTYSVTQTVNGCTSVSSAAVTAAPLAAPAAPTVTVADNCGTSTLTASGATGATFAWSNGANGASINVGAGSYTATQTVNGCTSVASASVTAAPRTIPAAPGVTVVNNCGSSTLTASGISGATFTWTPGNSTGASITVTSAGTYSVTQTAGGCTSTAAQASAAPKSIPVVAAISGTTTVAAGSTTQLSDATSGGTWSSNSANATVNGSGLVTGVTAGSAVISYTVTNGGCSATVTTTVTVTAPTCIVPVITQANVTANPASGKCGATVTYTPAINATPSATVSYVFTGATTGSGTGTGSGANFNTGVTTVTLTAKNSCGTATASFTVSVIDNQAPVPNVATLPVITGECSTGAAVSTGNTGFSCSDDCRCCRNGCHCRVNTCTCRNYDYQSRIVSIISYLINLYFNYGDDDNHGCDHSDNNGATITAPTATDNCKGTITGTTTDPLSYSGAGTYTIHWTYDDGNGNVTTQNQTVVLTDNSKPVLNEPADVTVSCGSSVSPSVTGNATASDNCGTVTITYSDVTVGNKITRTWKATDNSGNYSTDTQIITIVDNVKPVLTEPNDITVGCGGSTAPSVTGMATATDNCGNVTITYSDNTSGNRISRTWKATDGAGNYVTDVQIITIGSPFSVSVNSVPTNSTYTGGVSTNLYLGYGAQSTTLQLCSLPSSGAPYTYSWSGTAANKLNSTTTASPVFTPSTNGYYTFTVTVTNRYGCTATASISICVTDIRVPGTNGSKVYVCHATYSGHKTSYQTLQVALNQVSSHVGTSYCGSSDDRLGSCDQTPCGYTGSNSVEPSIVANSSSMTKEGGETASTTEEDLKVTVMPNPSTTIFTLKLESRYETPVNLRVMDGTGRVVDAKTKLGANSTIQIGASYTSGTYYAELTQGSVRKVVQLIKVRG